MRKHRLVAAVWFGVLWLAFPALPAVARGACSPEWEKYYRKGVAVGDKHTAGGSGCAESCLHEMSYFYRRAVELCPESDKAHTNLADVLEKQGRYVEAEKHYRRAVAIDPKRFEAHFGLGDLALGARDYTAAVQHYDQGLELRPGDELATRYRTAALCLMKPECPQSEAIASALGGPELKLMGPAGLKPPRRLPLQVEFDYEKETLPPEAAPVIQKLGAELRRISEAEPEIVFLIEGHTDPRGTDAYNDDLSERRARRVASELVGPFGIASERVAIKGFGKRQPRRAGTSDAAHQANRRVEVVRYEKPQLAGLLGETGAQPVGSSSPAFTGNTLSVHAAVFYEDAEARPQKLYDGATMRSGDGYRIYFTANKRSYVYVVQVDSSNKMFPVFPYAAYGHTDNLVERGREYWIPPDSQWLELDKTRGQETIYFITSRDRRTDIEDLLRRVESAGDDAHAAAAAAQEAEIVIKPMGILPDARPARQVEVTSRRGESRELTVEGLSTPGSEIVQTIRFHHE